MKTNPKGRRAEAKSPRKRFLRLFSALVIFSIIASLLLWPAPYSEPKYQGITLSSWVARYNNEVDAEPQRDEAAEAIQKIGSNAVPVLIRWLNASDLKLKLVVMALAQKQSFVKFNFTDAEEYHERALEVFAQLGAGAKSAIPELEEMLRKPEFRGEALEALCLIGPDAHPALINGLTNANAEIREATGEAITYSYLSAVLRGPSVELDLPTPLLSRLLQDSEDSVRIAAMLQIGIGHQTKPTQPDIIVPLLMRELSSTNGDERIQAAKALAKFGPDAKPAIPNLLNELTNEETDADARMYPLYALRTIGAPDAAIVAALEQNLQSRHFKAIICSADILGCYKALARSAIPALLKAGDGSDAKTRTAIYSPLINIDPNSAKDYARTLGVVYNESDVVVPELIRQLSDSDVLARKSAADRLGNFGPDARVAVSHLMLAVSDKDKTVRAAALEALKKIDPRMNGKADTQ